MRVEINSGEKQVPEMGKTDVCFLLIAHMVIVQIA